MFDRFFTNPTQLTGVLSFSVATVACTIATLRSDARDARKWKVLAFVNLLMAIEVFVGLRHYIHDIADNMLTKKGLYIERQNTQEIIIVLLAVASFIFAMVSLFLRQSASGAARVAMSITIFLLGLFAIETVSLHAVDAVFYRPVGPVFLIGWLWVSAAAGTCLAAAHR